MDIHGVELFRREGLRGAQNTLDIDAIYESAAAVKEPEILVIWDKPERKATLRLIPLLQIPSQLKKLVEELGTPLLVLAVDAEEFPPNTYP